MLAEKNKYIGASTCNSGVNDTDEFVSGNLELKEYGIDKLHCCLPSIRAKYVSCGMTYKCRIQTAEINWLEIIKCV